jgi:phosphoglycolate phosphatase-like HAD superfamily hydrolase
VRESLQKLQGRADLIVVSTTASDALHREWNAQDMAQYVSVMAGQNMGTKKQHLEFAAKGKYPDECILMIGDALGDCEAAHAVGVLFYPICPGAEELSWQRFYQEASDKFLYGEYAGTYEAERIAEFDKLLSDTPPWMR